MTAPIVYFIDDSATMREVIKTLFEAIEREQDLRGNL